MKQLNQLAKNFTTFMMTMSTPPPPPHQKKNIIFNKFLPNYKYTPKFNPKEGISHRLYINLITLKKVTLLLI